MRISTGAASLDALLDNGVLRGHVVELYGASGAGASILAHSIAINAAISRGVALWLDSGNNAFSAVRALALVRRALTFRAKSDPDELARDDQAAAEVLLSRMLVSVVVDAFALVRALRQVADAPASSSERPLRLLIVDSLGALMSPLVSMPGAQAVGQATIALVARLLKAIAVEHNAVVLVVNYALQDGQPALGRAWRYVANERILLERSVGSARVRATLTRANSQFAGHHVDFEIADNHLVPAVDIEPWKC
jgi:RecA/RadA recombinase